MSVGIQKNISLLEVAVDNSDLLEMHGHTHIYTDICHVVCLKMFLRTYIHLSALKNETHTHRDTGRELSSFSSTTTTCNDEEAHPVKTSQGQDKLSHVHPDVTFLQELALVQKPGQVAAAHEVYKEF